jgi:pSer/pThr/pTyr-binding forkhead associated (FHA) protein
MGVRLTMLDGPGTEEGGEASQWAFDQPRVVLGRGRGADVRLPHRGVSVRHATLDRGPGGWTVTDQSSTNGVRVNGRRLVPGRPKRLSAGDRLDVGVYRLGFEEGLVHVPTDAESTRSLALRLARAAYLGEVPAEEAAPSVTVLNGPRQGHREILPPPPAELVVGRGEDCDLILPDADASRRHATLHVSTCSVVIEDLSSKNGLVLRGKVLRAARLSPGDEVRVGSTVLLYDDPARPLVEAVEGGEDEVLPEPEPEPEPEAGEALPAPADAPTVADAPPPPVTAPGLPTVDAIIYVLASAVFALSLLGLLWLFASG